MNKIHITRVSAGNVDAFPTPHQTSVVVDQETLASNFLCKKEKKIHTKLKLKKDQELNLMPKKRKRESQNEINIILLLPY